MIKFPLKIDLVERSDPRPGTWTARCADLNLSCTALVRETAIYILESYVLDVLARKLKCGAIEDLGGLFEIDDQTRAE